MNIGAYAEQKEIAINTIGRKLGIDLSPESLPKAREQKILELFQLQKIAELADYGCDCEAPLIERISKIEGIGPSTIKKIIDGLASPRPDGSE